MDFPDGEMGDIPTRPMRVKILYTFDEDKTKCLARLQDVLQIPAVAIDESSQVGVIDLHKCLQAVVGASPELLSRLSEGDFTIYAYDYSEYDTPLVGQGMLSAALTSGTSDQQNKSMITGRVCKNVMGLFSNGVKETLEVKLRLVSVPKPTQNDFSRSMETLRGMSPAMSGGFDPNAWNASMQSNKAQQSNDYLNLNVMVGGDGSGANGLVDDLFGLNSQSGGSAGGQQLTGGAGIAETPSDGIQGFNPAFAAHPHSAPGSRAGSPMMGPEPSTRNDMLRHQSFSGNPSTLISEQSRPGSRASQRGEVDASDLARQAYSSRQHDAQPTELYYNEDGQPRKRARVQQADWRGRSSFGSKSGDLRVTAATAASMHMHRPIPKRPSAPGSNLEPPPRVPTPVPQRTNMLPHQQQPGGRRSMLRLASVADSDFMSDIDQFSDAIASSPDDDSPGNSITAEGTPQDIPSSPPVFPSTNLPEPSSPGLPTYQNSRMVDSGYMSGGLHSSNVMESMEDDPNRSPDAQDYEMAARYQRREKSSQPVVKIEPGTNELQPSDSGIVLQEMNFEMVTPGDPNQLPQKMRLNLPRGRRDGSQGPSQTSNKRPAPAQRAASKVRTPAPTPGGTGASRRGSLALPPSAPLMSSDLPDIPPKSQPVPRKRQSLHRSRTASNESEAGSPAPSDNEGGRPKGPGRSGSGAQRRKIIEDRLKSSIANGEMPQYCSHCGAIETPTWRRLYIKEVEGKPTGLDEAEGEGETIGVEVTEIDEKTGEPTKFLIRKSMKKTKDMQPGAGFSDVIVCNPCGLWFIKYRSMRPSDKWHRKPVPRKSRKQKMADEGLMTDGMEPQSDMFFTDQIMPEDAGEDADVEEDNQADLPLNPAPVRGHRPRANSLQVSHTAHIDGRREWNASQLNSALAREVQSSPVRFQGSQASPIELEDPTPKPTRRLLFPSPRKEGEVKSLDDNAQVSLKAMPHFDQMIHDKTGIDFNFEGTETNVFEAFAFDKENMMPPLNADGTFDNLAHLFEGSPSGLFKTPFKTPAKAPSTPSRSLRQQIPKTPTTNRSNKRKPLTPNPNAANNGTFANNAVAATAVVNDFMTSPSSSRYFLRSTPSRVERNTPGRLSSGNKGSAGDAVSPWSRHLAAMLSDAANDGSSNIFTSPSRGIPGGFDFSDLPDFGTPGKNGWESWEGVLSSEFDGFQEANGTEL